MRIACIALMRIPTEKAHGYQTMRVLHELARMGHEVSLHIPTRRNHITEDAFDYYGLEKNFSIEYVLCRDYLPLASVLGPFAFWLTMRSFLHNLVLPSGAVVYTRDAAIVAHASARGSACVYNAHNWAPGRAVRVGKARGVVCNSRGTEAAVRESLPNIPTAVVHNAADPNPFVGADKRTLRGELNLPTDKKIVLYSGHLYGWKGARIFVDTAQRCPDPDYLFVAIGGTQEDVERLRSETRNVSQLLLLGHQPRALVPKYLAAADVLVLPNTTQTEESTKFTSPIKLFEYMASGVPVVASDLPSLREVLSEGTALLVPPDSDEALLEAVQHTITAPDEAAARAKRALEVAAEHTWNAHASAVAQFIASVV